MCEENILFDYVLLATMASQDFSVSYPAMKSSDEEENVECTIKMTLNLQTECWCYNRNLEECKVIKKEKNNSI